MIRARRARRLLGAAAAACAAACAAGCASGGASAPSPVVKQVGGATVRYTPTASAAEPLDLPFGPDEAFALLPDAFAALGLPVQGMQPTARTIDSGPFRARTTLAGERLAALVDCGTSATGGRNADSYDVTLRVVSQVTTSGSGGHAQLATTVRATGRPNATSGMEVNCPSAQRLEQRIAEAVARRAAR